MNYLSKRILTNDIFLYLFSRYITYFVMFITSMIIATKLGPYYFGVWSFILLIIQYIQNFDFGIPNSYNVFYIHNKEDSVAKSSYTINAVYLISLLSLLVLILSVLIAQYDINLIKKYRIEKYIPLIGVISAFQFYYNFVVAFLRVSNNFKSLTFVISFVGVFSFIAALLFTGERLLILLSVGYIIAYMLSIIIALVNNSYVLHISWKMDINLQRKIIKKGFYLFLYNLFINSIILSLRFLISTYYRVEDFGIFSFSYSLVLAIMLLLNSVSFLVFPKIIDKLSGIDNNNVLESINIYRKCYVFSSHLLIYCAFPVFPLFLIFFPQYHGALQSLEIISLTILLSTHTAGFVELLIAQNRERLLSLFSFYAFVINALLAWLFIEKVNMPFSHVILATLITYLLYTEVLSFFGLKILNLKYTIKNIFFISNIRLLFPYGTALVVSLANIKSLVLLPLLLFLIFNKEEIKNLFLMIKKLIIDPSLIRVG